VDLAGLASGIYTLVLAYGVERSSLRFIKE
jgi:hypothetical protein